MPDNLLIKKRIDSIDVLRGIIMVIMALDHVRDFFHISAMTSNPTDPATNTVWLFFTRWITHFCAPIFVLLAGASVFLAGRKMSQKELSLYLVKRGFWLVVLELILFNLIFSFDPFYHFIVIQVIWVIGISMLIMALCVYLPVYAILAIGILMVAGHNLLDVWNAPPASPVSFWWGIFHQQNFTEYQPGYVFGVLYPLLPWPGIMMIGYAMGSLFTSHYDPIKRRKILMRSGMVAILVFFLLRGINVYGDLFPWQTQKNTTATMLSFLNLTKYPPSFLFCCMTIGPALVLLAWLEKIKSVITDLMVIFGRVPMFYYILHFFIIHLLTVIAFFISGFTIDQANTGMIYFRPLNFGYPLWAVYLIWIALVAALYYPCKKYSVFKASHTYWWLSYL